MKKRKIKHTILLLILGIFALCGLACMDVTQQAPPVEKAAQPRPFIPNTQQLPPVAAEMQQSVPFSPATQKTIPVNTETQQSIPPAVSRFLPEQDVAWHSAAPTLRPDSQFMLEGAGNQTVKTSCTLHFADVNSGDDQLFKSLLNSFNNLMELLQLILNGPQSVPDALKKEVYNALHNQTLRQNSTLDCTVFKQMIRELERISEIARRASQYMIPLGERGSF